MFKLVSNISIASIDDHSDNLAWRITKVAFHCLIAAVFIIPAGLAWAAGKSISTFSKTKIDHDFLYLAPPEVQIPKDLNTDWKIDIRILSHKYNALNIEEDRSSDQTPKRVCLEQLCDRVAREDENLYPDDLEKRRMFCKQLSLYLKGIIKKLDSGEVSKDKEKQILMELAEAATRCYPTWIQVSSNLYAEINGQVETVEVKLLRLIQDYKESIILEFCQNEANAQWHSLNFVRNVMGEDLGLNTSLNKYDPYALDDDPTFSKGLIKWMFLQKYENVNRLVSSIQTTINSKDYDGSYYDFLVETIRQQNIESPNDYVAEHFYDEDYKLKDAGANLLLRSIGIVKGG